jgi:hypothetical protein
LGDETILIASRFSRAVDLLSELAAEDARSKLTKAHGAGLAAAVRGALDAVEEIYAAGTKGLRNWPEQGRRVLAQVAAMRAALDASGIGPDVRRMAGALVETIERSGGG